MAKKPGPKAGTKRRRTSSTQSPASASATKRAAATAIKTNSKASKRDPAPARTRAAKRSATTNTGSTARQAARKRGSSSGTKQQQTGAAKTASSGTWSKARNIVAAALTAAAAALLFNKRRDIMDFIESKSANDEVTEAGQALQTDAGGVAAPIKKTRKTGKLGKAAEKAKAGAGRASDALPKPRPSKAGARKKNDDATGAAPTDIAPVGTPVGDDAGFGKAGTKKRRGRKVNTKRAAAAPVTSGTMSIAALNQGEASPFAMAAATAPTGATADAPEGGTTDGSGGAAAPRDRSDS
jgi:hypothetical protein